MAENTNIICTPGHCVCGADLPMPAEPKVKTARYDWERHMGLDTFCARNDFRFNGGILEQRWISEGHQDRWVQVPSVDPEGSYILPDKK